MKISPKPCRVVQNQGFENCLLVALLACFWAPRGTYLAILLGLFAYPGLSWACLGDTNVIPDLEHLTFLSALDCRGRP